MKFTMPAEKPRKPTPKQLDFIAEIETIIDEDFKGSTFDEASDWIDEHIDMYNEVMNHRRGDYL